MRLLGISGSLRRASLNTAALEAAVRLTPPGMDLDLYRGLRHLPLYDYDLDSDTPPVPVQDLRRLVASADGLIVATPEYAHGIAGPMKNALDWLVGDVAFPGKRIALWNTSPRATLAQGHLREVLRTMSACVVEDASLALPLLGSAWTPDKIAATPDLARGIEMALARFARDPSRP